MQRNIVKILGCNVDSFTQEEAVDYIYQNHGHTVTINPEMITKAQNDTEFRQIINDAEMIIPDGIGVELGLKILGHNVKRIAGIEFGKKLIIKFSKEGKRIAFVGAKHGVAENAVKNLKLEIPDLNAVYIRDGYFENDEQVINDLTSAAPDLVLAAIGSPKQEYFISKLKKQLPNCTMIGLGGSFDVWSGNVQRAPLIWQNLGLEWLYRTIKEPKRIRRIFPALPLFVLRVFKERVYS